MENQSFSPEELADEPPMQLHTTIRRSVQIGELVTALAKAQGEFEALKKDSDNPFYGSKYADLAGVIAAIRMPLSKNGIAIIHFPQSDLARQVASMTVGFYKGEQFIEVEAEAPATAKGKDSLPKFDVQTLGACWTYLRRYLMQGLAALASEDDDGNSLQGNNGPIPGKGQSQRTTPAQATRDKQAAPADPPPAAKQDPGTFLFLPPDRLTCVIRSVQEKETAGAKKAKYLSVIFNGYHKTFNFGACWDTKQFNALRAGVGKECQLKIGMAKDDKFINITDVLYVDGVPYDLGEPSGQQDPLPE